MMGGTKPVGKCGKKTFWEGQKPNYAYSNLSQDTQQLGIDFSLSKAWSSQLRQQLLLHEKGLQGNTYATCVVSHGYGVLGPSLAASQGGAAMSESRP